MHTWFECKIRYEKTMDNGMNKKVTEPYLVDALSFTEAEARIIEEMTPFISGEFTVSDIKRANYSELFPCEEDSADRWFKCKLYFITSDEKSGAEKKTATNVLVQAADLRDAVNKLDEGMKGTMADYQIASVAETAPLWTSIHMPQMSPLRIPSVKMPIRLLYEISYNLSPKVAGQR